MAIKINNKFIGETPEEQRRLEEKRFQLRQERKKTARAQRKQELRNLGKGSRKLSEF